MIIETGRISAIEPGGLWVETLQRSACDTCQAQKGCGQRLLGARAGELWVLVDESRAKPYRVGDEVQVAIAEDVLVKSALLVYLLPLLVMMLFVMLVHNLDKSDGATALAALFGLLIGAAIVRVRSWQKRFDTRLQPVLVDESVRIPAVQRCEAD
jgi:sigma-E factor negative regulatory protein RseC